MTGMVSATGFQEKEMEKKDDNGDNNDEGKISMKNLIIGKRR